MQPCFCFSDQALEITKQSKAKGNFAKEVGFTMAFTENGKVHAEIFVLSKVEETCLIWFLAC